jgi:hypothetical protein
MRLEVPTAGLDAVQMIGGVRLMPHKAESPSESRYGGELRTSLNDPSLPPFSGGKGRARAQNNSDDSPREGLASSQGKVNLHLRLNFDRFSIEQVRPVLPLFHGLDRSRSQHWMSAD